MKLSHRVRISVSGPETDREPVLESARTSLRSRLLRRLVGDSYAVLVILRIFQSLHWPLPSLRAARVIDAMIHSTGYMPFSVTLTSASPSLSVIPDSVWAGVF